MINNFWLKLSKPIVALAPMAGYTDSAFRLLCREFGADVVYSEMISVDGLCYKNKKTLDLLKFNSKECPLVFQLFGTDPDKFASAVKIINKIIAHHPVGIDINFGCPAPKVAQNGAGAALMNDLNKSYKIIQAVCDNSQLPVSIKIRAGIKNVSALDFIKKVKNLPWAAVMIHGRTLKQGFNGDIDCDLIKKIKTLIPDKIVLANGGLNSLEDAKDILNKTGADGLGLARGVIGNPWLFQEIKNNRSINTTLAERKKIILRHAKLFLKDNNNLIPLRKHLVHYFKGQKNASGWRQKIIQAETLSGIKSII
ncbi:tRNA-dihydrouridine synthase [Candidatus Kuenenbacteria bacterium]|nr:tRNA-dihydrouridine synthase [Candidatus Kuenenbacteria bacterium]